MFQAFVISWVLALFFLIGSAFFGTDALNRNGQAMGITPSLNLRAVLWASALFALFAVTAIVGAVFFAAWYVAGA